MNTTIFIVWFWIIPSLIVILGTYIRFKIETPKEDHNLKNICSGEYGFVLSLSIFPIINIMICLIFIGVHITNMIEGPIAKIAEKIKI